MPEYSSSDSRSNALTAHLSPTAVLIAEQCQKPNSKQDKRAVNRCTKICTERLIKLDVCDDRGGQKLTESCGGLFVYMPSRGKITAATSKLDHPFLQRGCLSLIEQLAEQHGWSFDGSKTDPFVVCNPASHSHRHVWNCQLAARVCSNVR